MASICAAQIWRQRPATSVCASLLVSPRRAPSPSSKARCFGVCHARMAKSAGSDDSVSDEKRFSKTLHLPETAFAMRTDPQVREKLFRNRTCGELYRWQAKHNKGEPFVLHDGPPYANGDLHLGHSLNKIVKDIINRFQALQGRPVNYIPGWDCHGLPIEVKVTSKLPPDATPQQIRAAAKQVAQEAIETQKQQFQDLAIMTDWSDATTYRTLDSSFEARQLRIFGHMARRGLIYRALRPVYWSPSSRTALAEAELEYNEKHVSRSAYVEFPLIAGDTLFKLAGESKVQGLQQRLQSGEASLVIWTTTPWTLPSNKAVAISPTLSYSLVRSRSNDKLYLIATSRLDGFQELKRGLATSRKPGEADSRSLVGDCEELLSFEGSALMDSTYKHLFLTPSEPARPILSASFVTADSGTGVVHMAPAHGAEDFALYKTTGWLEKEGLFSPVDGEGRFTTDVDQLGTPAMEAGRRLVGTEVLGAGGREVLKMLDEENVLVSETPIKHKYPYDWRTKLPIITRGTAQWFADLSAIKDDALAALESVKFVPPQSRKRLQTFVRDRSEWCISRQRAWGVPIPVLYDVATDEPLLTDANVAHISHVLEEKGTDHWWVGEADEFVAPEHRAEGRSWRKGMDTIDVWFDSGSSWSLLRDPDSTQPPPVGQDGRTRPIADVYLEGSDQHRGWFQSSLLTAVAVGRRITGEGTAPSAPFANVITHGFTVDSQGRKMSKSIGNTIDPRTIIHGGADKKRDPAFGTDVIRLWAAKADYTSDMPIGKLIMRDTAENIRKWRNTARFMLANLPPPQEVPVLEEQDLSFSDRFALFELSELSEACKVSYEKFDFSSVVRRMNEYVIKSLSSLYLDIAKDTLYADSKSSGSRRAKIAVLDHILRTYTSIIAPILPHLAEDIFHYRNGATTDPAKDVRDAPSIFHLGWQDVDKRWRDEELGEEGRLILKIRNEVLLLIEGVRKANHVRSAYEADVTLLVHEDNTVTAKALHKHAADLANFFLVSHVRVVSRDAQTTGHVWSQDSQRVIDGVSVRVIPASGIKCPRCWTFRRDEGKELCVRCESAVEELQSHQAGTSPH